MAAFRGKVAYLVDVLGERLSMRRCDSLAKHLVRSGLGRKGPSTKGYDMFRPLEPSELVKYASILAHVYFKVVQP